MVAALNVRLLSNVDAAQLVQRFVTQVDSESLSFGDDEVIAKLMGQIRETLPTFQKSLNQVKGSSDSAKLSQLDRLRDQTLQLLFDAIGLYRYEEDEEKKRAYEDLNRLFKTFKSAKDTDYERESSMIKSLLEKLAISPNKEAVTLLNIKTYINRLVNSQADFE